uniref:lysozyme n=1 Tax=Lutzomyia longipalpis TaxID=7200 RepID=A0A1B0CTG4_LUTLO
MNRVAHVIAAAFLILSSGECRVYDRCELALELKYRHEIVSEAEVATWVCIAQHQSAFDTAAVGRQADGRGYHGLLQISDEFWCSVAGQGKACAMSCSRLTDDDITDDLHCSRIIHEEHQRISGDGFNAWTVYRDHCNGGRALPYIHGCFDNYISREDVPVRSPIRPVYTPSSSFRTKFRTHLEKARAKIYDRCELAQELVYKHHVPIEEVATWVCIAKHESNFNTSAVGHLNADGSGDHGLFQISDIYWCSPPGKGWVCGLSCAQLEDDDISDDVKCMRKIYAEHQRLSGDGFNAWAVYSPHCRGRAEKYIDGCFTEDDQDNAIQPIPGIVAPIHPPSFTLPTPRKQGKIYSRCELAHELLHVHLLPRHEIPTWVCIAEHESSLNTAAVGRLNADGSADHGLFQISDLYWCSPPGNGLGCGISCDLLEDDDIADDVECIRRIHKEHTRISGNGFTAWTVYNRNCLGNVDHYVQGCFSEEIPTTTESSTTTTKRPTTTEKSTTTTERPTTAKVFSFSFGERIPSTEAPRREIISTTTPSRIFTFKYPSRFPFTTDATPSSPTTTQRTFTTTKAPFFKTTTVEARTEAATEVRTEPTVRVEAAAAHTDAAAFLPPSTTRRPSVFDIYFRRTTTTTPKVFAPKSTTYFANSLPTVKPFDLDYIKGLTTPKNIISRAAPVAPQSIHFDTLFDTFFHG